MPHWHGTFWITGEVGFMLVQPSEKREGIAALAYAATCVWAASQASIAFLRVGPQ
jgi:hypothetical protein